MLAVTLNGRKYSTTDMFWSVSEDPGKITLTDAGNDSTVYYNSDDDHSEVISVSFANNPSYAPAIEWSSSDPEVIAVDQDGTITPIKDGSADITASVISTGETATISVKSHIQASDLTLSEPLHDILIIKKTGVDVIDEYSALTLTAEAAPANGLTATDPIIWNSSDPEVATVNNGTLTLLKGGSVTITATIDGIEKSRDLEIIDFDVYREDNGNRLTGTESSFSGALSPTYTINVETGNNSISPEKLISTGWKTDWNFNNTNGIEGTSVSGEGFVGYLKRTVSLTKGRVNIAVSYQDINVATIWFDTKF